jgi:hypothetical protein
MKTARTAFRLIRHAGIIQTDWHAGQFIFPSPPDFTKHGANVPRDDTRLNLVCIDFAFAVQWPCLCHTPTMDDWEKLLYTMLDAGIEDSESMRAHWTPRDELEW